MHDPGTDPLSPLARQVINAGKYEKLTVDGAPSDEANQLEGVTPEQLLVVPVTNRVAGFAMLAGLWLWAEDLEHSHMISQKSPDELLRTGPRSLNTLSNQTSFDGEATLAFWHAIMHRREGDFSNSKYWYARCANHAALPVMAATAAKHVHAMPADKALLRLVATGWNPNAFVDLVQAVHASPNDPRYSLAVALQRMEWQVLFDHCTRAAVATAG
jgi:hypothetical protein